MDLKATACLKLVYLEMFGHDMSWAAFHVLEVMSSQKYIQKRVGYLAAVQSFRPDTEVLMLAENLLKKDLNSATPTTISLPLQAIPHVISPSMANSLLSDLLPRLTHSNPNIRKKTIVTLYRLALVYPETLRPAWPKIKDRLQDENEDPSVTSAVINVVCELGWRRPQDFLPLAPRLFDLLVASGNNWMGIKIIKLFATLTPLEPRLVKKLLPPLTNLIKTTPAMSLLYECINGIVQGGILESVEGTAEGEEVARLCVGKLRGMLVVEGDPNLRYVALLAFQKIVASHPHLVSLHQDVILECIDDPDISIRMRALDLVVGMVNADNLEMIVSRLMNQLESAPIASSTEDPANDRGAFHGIEPQADSDEDDLEETIRPATERRSDQPPPLPEDYRISVMKQILTLCSHETYANVTDFEWYINILVKLVRVCPPIKRDSSSANGASTGSATPDRRDISYEIGDELLNVAVRVRSLRADTTMAAQSLLLIDQREYLFPTTGNGGQGVLSSAAWLAGEYAFLLSNPSGVLTSLMDSSSAQLPPHILAVYIQAIPKIFCAIGSNVSISWTPERRATMSLLLARIVYFLEPLATHPDLEVQERAVEFLELTRLAAEAASSQAVPETDGDYAEPPLLLTQAIPSLFKDSGAELNPVAPGAQKKVPLPVELDLDTPINPRLHELLRQADFDNSLIIVDEDIDNFYNVRAAGPEIRIESASERLDRMQAESEAVSYQGSAADYLDAEVAAKHKSERKERNKDDPFYIGDRSRSPGRRSGTSTPLGNILRGSNGEELDIDSIPIMDLDLTGGRSGDVSHDEGNGRSRRPRRHFEILTDENVGEEHLSSSSRPRSRDPSRPDMETRASQKGKKGLLQVDSSGLGSFSLDESASGRAPIDYEAREAEERALKEVERLRMEMERASERVKMRDEGVPEDGVVVKRKKKKVKKADAAEAEVGRDMPGGEEGPTVKKKKKKVKKKDTVDEGAEGAEAMIAVAAEEDPVAKPKRKKKRVVDLGPSPEEAQ
ncbi:Adaptor protein complex AP-3 delta subunit [Rhizodiscina lignyota]|uniref:AP-3 complex subunit delta n=1 Tax=Rhizodiscina lignyota TaxID=1504668 RepID=A0A9P4IG03_9PEZI|nr:Adaptor protein complex AP-3 delta subunit [Rhizodiscina lignyota]